MARKRKGRTNPPLKCTDSFELRCITFDPKGIIFSCKVYPMYNEKKVCADAKIDIIKGKVTFYDLP